MVWGRVSLLSWAGQIGRGCGTSRRRSRQGEEARRAGGSGHRWEAGSLEFPGPGQAAGGAGPEGPKVGGSPGPVVSLLRNEHETLDRQPVCWGSPGGHCFGLRLEHAETLSVSRGGSKRLCQRLAGKCPQRSRGSLWSLGGEVVVPARPERGPLYLPQLQEPPFPEDLASPLLLPAVRRSTASRRVGLGNSPRCGCSPDPPSSCHRGPWS